jgi:ribokinase
MKEILVVGSSNTDMVLRLKEIPQPGQTVMGGDFKVFAGGKGANQAVAARRAGGEVRFITAVGNDDFGKAAIDGFNREGIYTENIQVLEGVPSGVAMIFVSEEGENCIGVAPGANKELASGFLEANSQVFTQCSHLLVQLEIPMETVETVVRLASENGVQTILNPAPAAKLSSQILQDLYCITPNEHEAEELTGITVMNLESAQRSANALLQLGVQNVVITLGGDGALLVNSQGMHHQDAEKVDVIDTTAAGDTFNGVLAALLAEGRPLKESIRLAVKGATLAVQQHGASDSVPYRRAFITG